MTHGGQKGWTCPGCGSVYAPWVYKCYTCPTKVTLTASTIDKTTCAHDWEQTTGGTRCRRCGATFHRVDTETPRG